MYLCLNEDAYLEGPATYVLKAQTSQRAFDLCL